MLRELVPAVVIPLLVLLLAMLALEQPGRSATALAALIGRAPVLALEHRHLSNHRPVAAALVAAALMLRPPAAGVAPETPQSIRDGGVG